MTGFVATNRLEQAVLDAREGKVRPSTLFEVLHASPVFVRINRDPGPTGQWEDDTTLLVLDSPSGFKVIAVFSAQAQAAAWQDGAQQFPHVLQVHFSWLLGGVVEDVGIVLNPGSPMGVELAPAMVQKLQHSLGAH